MLEAVEVYTYKGYLYAVMKLGKVPDDVHVRWKRTMLIEWHEDCAILHDENKRKVIKVKFLEEEDNG